MILHSAVDNVDASQLIRKLSEVEQDSHKCRIPCLDHKSPEFYWIFKNMDFESWRSASAGELWLSGPEDRNLDQFASYIIDQAKMNSSNTQEYVLYFFCGTAEQLSGTTVLVNAFLDQLIGYLPPVDRALVISVFLRTILDLMLGKDATLLEWISDLKDSSPDLIVQQMVELSSGEEQLEALKAVLELKQFHIECLCVIVAGLDRVLQTEKSEFVRDILLLVTYLQESPWKVKVLLTSLPRDEFKFLLNGLPSIEHDKERKG